jgi:hypothetical protein
LFFISKFIKMTEIINRQQQQQQTAHQIQQQKHDLDELFKIKLKTLNNETPSLIPQFIDNVNLTIFYKNHFYSSFYSIFALQNLKIDTTSINNNIPKTTITFKEVFQYLNDFYHFYFNEHSIERSFKTLAQQFNDQLESTLKDIDDKLVDTLETKYQNYSINKSDVSNLNVNNYNKKKLIIKHYNLLLILKY